MADGYLHPRYAEAFTEHGTPRFLPRSGGWVLERAIPGTAQRDAMGCYPRLVCRDWSALCADVEELGPGLVSLVAVTDALANVPTTELERCFDAIAPYKDHHVVELHHRQTSRHHAHRVRLAARDGVTVEPSTRPLDHLEEWLRLYSALVAHRGVTGLQAFSRTSFEHQLSVPGAVMFRALHEGQAVAAQIWFVHDERAYSHLTATDQRGYRLRATFRLYDCALDRLAESCEIADLGAGAGATRASDDGLDSFKAGWASGTRPSQLCARVFDRAAYDELSDGCGGSGYFPAYRSGEMG